MIDPVRALLNIEMKQEILLTKVRNLETRLAVLSDKRVRALHRLKVQDRDRLNALKATGEDSARLLARLDRENQPSVPF